MFRYHKGRSFLIVSLTLLVPSIFGRTPFIAAFKPFLIRTLGFPEVWLSLTYTLGTLLASFSVPLVVRGLGQTFPLANGFRTVYLLFLGGFFSFFIAFGLKTQPWLSLIFLGLGYFGLRLCGQGLLPTLVKTYTAFSHNDKQCAWIAAVHTACTVLFNGTILYVLAHCDALSCGAHILFLPMGIFFMLMLWIPRALPRVQSLAVTGKKLFGLGRDFPAFFKWGMFAIAFQNLQATAIAFHLSDFALEQAIPLASIFKIFLPISILELLFNPCVAALYARFSVKTLTQIVLWNLCFINLSWVFFQWNWAKMLFILATALGWSLNHILLYGLPAYALPKPKQAMGYATFTAWTCFCSACGPLLYSVFVNFGASYHQLGCVMGLCSFVWALCTLWPTK